MFEKGLLVGNFVVLLVHVLYCIEGYSIIRLLLSTDSLDITIICVSNQRRMLYNSTSSYTGIV
jgi:hypothetical protein